MSEERARYAAPLREHQAEYAALLAEWLRLEARATAFRRVLRSTRFATAEDKLAALRAVLAADDPTAAAGS